MCRHDPEVLKRDCMNCDRDLDEFIDFAKNNLVHEESEHYQLIKRCWFAAIRHVERDSF